MSIGGIRYHGGGIGVHADSVLRFDLPGGRCEWMSAEVGVDDEVGDRGSVVFRAFVDDRATRGLDDRIFDSGVMRGGDRAKTANASIGPGDRLAPKVLAAGDGNAADHADWAGLRLSR